MQGWGESCRGGWVMQGWGGVGHVGVGGSCRGGVGWVIQGWGVMDHTGVGYVMQGWVGHAGVGGSCRCGVGCVMQGMGWVIQEWGGVSG